MEKVKKKIKACKASGSFHKSPPKQKKNVKENDSENGKTQTRLYWP